MKRRTFIKSLLGSVAVMAAGAPAIKSGANVEDFEITHKNMTDDRIENFMSAIEELYQKSLQQLIEQEDRAVLEMLNKGSSL